MKITPESLRSSLELERLFGKSLNPTGEFGMKLEILREREGAESTIYTEFSQGAFTALTLIIDGIYNPELPLEIIADNLKDMELNPAFIRGFTQVLANIDILIKEDGDRQKLREYAYSIYESAYFGFVPRGAKR